MAPFDKIFDRTDPLIKAHLTDWEFYWMRVTWILALLPLVVAEGS